MKKNNIGFTLIEMMIVVAVIGILSAIAFPSYQAYMQDGRRAEVQHFALQQISVLERQYTRLGGYPAAFVTPANNSDAFYTFTYVTNPGAVGNNATSFTLSFSPKYSQASDKCGTMSINQQGTQTGSQADCWG